MRADADFMVFVAARWPALVRTAVTLGVRPEQAADATAEALSRCRRAWAGEGEGATGEGLVHEELVREAARRERLPEGDREAAAERTTVLAPPTLEELLDREAARRRAQRSLALKVAVPLALVVALVVAVVAVTGGGDAGQRGDKKDERDVGPAEVERQENPAPGVVWYADGELHLAHAVLAVDGLQDMTAIGSGVVYGDEEGRVVYAGDDGGREVLGHKAPGVPVAATDETGLAAWYDPSTREVRIVDAVSGDVRVHTEVGDDPDVVAVDGDVVYLVGADGARALLPTGPTSQSPVSPAELLDVRSRIRVFQLARDRIQVVQSAFNTTFELLGRGARLAPDGNTVVTTDPVSGALLVYDTRSGQRLDPGVSTDEEVLAAEPEVRSTLAYVVRSGDSRILRTCQLGTESTCQDVTELEGADGAVVLAR